jgi:hypothetical protein
MTVHASLLNGIVYKSRFSSAISKVLVAVETESISPFQKDKLIFRSMGIVTFHTVSFPNGFMTAFGILRQNFFVAFITNLIDFFVQKFPVRSRMGVMAF